MAGLIKKRKDYAFRHQFDEKPSNILGCPGVAELQTQLADQYAIGSMLISMLYLSAGRVS